MTLASLLVLLTAARAVFQRFDKVWLIHYPTHYRSLSTRLRLEVPLEIRHRYSTNSAHGHSFCTRGAERRHIVLSVAPR